MPEIEQLLIDADDTLWHNNVYYEKASEAFLRLCDKNGLNRKKIKKEFLDEEKKTVRERGYGSASYLSILELLFHRHLNSAGNDNSDVYNKIISEFRKHISKPPVLFEGVTAALKNLGSSYSLYILTKGNHDEQWKKIRRSGLLPCFREAFVEPEKNDRTYLRLLQENDWKPHHVCMIGNSPKSDINPALRAGMYAVYIPYEYFWAFDDEPLPETHDRLRRVDSFSQLPDLFQTNPF